MKIPFTKMQGLGNDFVVIDTTNHSFNLTPTQIRKMADRHFGIGFDQLLLIEPAPSTDVDFGYRIFNADGSEVAQCGNGARCIARYIHDHKLSRKSEIILGTAAGKLQTQMEKDNQITVNMGVPNFDPKGIPFITEQTSHRYLLHLDKQEVEIGAVSLGNPHAVLVVDDVDQAPVQTVGAEIEQHPRFPDRANVGFMQIISPRQIRLRVFERGSGETLACGSGACAAVAVGRINGLLTDPVQVQLLGGNLTIRWQGLGNPIWITGPAESVYTGEWL